MFINYLKKFILSLTLIILLSPTTYAYRTSYEPESDTSASYSTFSVLRAGNRLFDTTFVKYVTVDNINEFWLRIAIRDNKNKILYPATLIINNKEYPLIPVFDIPSRYEYAGLSVIDMDMSNKSANRYFKIPNDVAEKILTSDSDISLVLNLAKKSNIKINFEDAYIKNIKQILILNYNDLNTYWNPQN